MSEKTAETNGEICIKCNNNPCGCSKNKYKRKISPLDHSVFDCPLLKMATENPLPQLYVEPIFVPQNGKIKGNSHDNEDIFYDCSAGSEGDSNGNIKPAGHSSILDVINNIRNPHEFKVMLREMAQTSHVLYKCFKKAHHKAKKAERKIAVKCKKCAKDVNGRTEKLQKNYEVKNENPTTQNSFMMPLKVSSAVMSQNGVEIKSEGQPEMIQSPSYDRYWNLGSAETNMNCSPEDCSNPCGNHNDVGLGVPDKCTLARKYAEEASKIKVENQDSKETSLEIDVKENYRENVFGLSNHAKCFEDPKSSKDQSLLMCNCTKLSDYPPIASPNSSKDNSNIQSPFAGNNVTDPKDLKNILNCSCVPISPQDHSTHHRHKSKSHRKSPKSIKMQPISFILPINLQIQHRNNETQFVHTHLAMEAHAEMDNRKPTTQTKQNKQFMHVAQITSSQTQTVNGNKTTSGQYSAHLEQQTQAGNFSFSSEVFYSCSSSSVEDMKNLPPQRPCESLVEIFNIVKSRLDQDKCIPRQVLKTMVSNDINECLANDITTTPSFAEREETRVNIEALGNLGSKTKVPIKEESFQKIQPISKDIFENIQSAATEPKSTPWDDGNLDEPLLKIPTKIEYSGPSLSKSFGEVTPVPSQLLEEQKPEKVKFSIPQKVLPEDSLESVTQNKEIITSMDSQKSISPKPSNGTSTISTKPSVPPTGLSRSQGPKTSSPLKREQTFKTENDNLTTPTTAGFSDNIELKSEPALKAESMSDSKIRLDNSLDFRNIKTEPLTSEYHKEMHIPKSSNFSLETKSKLEFSSSTKVSEEVQTDVLSAQAEAHFRRNGIRREIQENLTELIAPTTSKYQAQDKNEILRDLFALFNPQKDGPISNETNYGNVLGKYSPSPSGSHKCHNREPCKFIKLQDIGLILNPKYNKKPSKHFSKNERDRVLIHLQQILQPRHGRINATPKDTQQILQNIQLILESKSDFDIPKIPSSLDVNMRNSVLEDIKYLLQIQCMKNPLEEFPSTSCALSQPYVALIPPARPKTISESKRELSSDEEIQINEQKKQGPPTPKKPKRKIQKLQKNDENEQIPKSNEVDNPKQMPLTEVRNRSVRIASTEPNATNLVSTSSDSFFIDLDEDLSDELERRSTTFQRRSRFKSGCDREAFLGENDGNRMTPKNNKIMLRVGSSNAEVENATNYPRYFKYPTLGIKRYSLFNIQRQQRKIMNERRRQIQTQANQEIPLTLALQSSKIKLFRL
ncbi:uncharacterized protein LOC109612233 isoform X2 [Musca domestica]|uniref:Uncharacterized protein LOC109612233 isoform X2 n=1 Tax=Musca domestica TaxID=7370 RepID=A0A9J7DEM2_MUSDO|nr:uncharacterized protein LOC109612233 isoform X2 [Musca domestica]